jgi:cytochrome oxidase assembly protein ShyY1
MNAISLNNAKNLQDIVEIKNRKDLNTNFAYKPIEITGYYDHGNTYYVDTYLNGVAGSKVLTPFVFKIDDREERIIVDRGFIYELSEIKDFNHKGIINIKGLLRFPHLTKNSLENNYYSTNLRSERLDEITSLVDRNAKNSGFTDKVILELYDFNEESIFPKQLDKISIKEFNCSPEGHACLAKAFSYLSYGILYGNMLFWICF